MTVESSALPGPHFTFHQNGNVSRDGGAGQQSFVIRVDQRVDLIPSGLRDLIEDRAGDLLLEEFLVQPWIQCEFAVFRGGLMTFYIGHGCSLHAEYRS